MKKYTNKILIITAIVLVLGLVIGYTIDFQTGYRSGRIKYEKIEKDSTKTLTFGSLKELDAYVDSVETSQKTSPEENKTSSNNQSETSHQ
jgi:hypothetical protein